MPPSDATVKVEYVVRCRENDVKNTSEKAAQHSAAYLNDEPLACNPHRVIKRTITELDVTEGG